MAGADAHRPARGSQAERDAHGTTRRRLLVAAAGASAVQLLPGGRSGADAAVREQPCVPRPPGMRRRALALTPDGRTLWTADTGAGSLTAFSTGDLTPGRSVAIGAAPKALAIAPNGRTAVVTAGFYAGPGLAIVDLVRHEVAARVAVGPDAMDVVLGHRGRRAYVTAGGRLVGVSVPAARVVEAVDVGAHPRGVALTRDGRHALVAVEGEAAVAVVDLHHHRVVARTPTDTYPYLIAVAPDGAHAYVSHAGFGARTVSVIDIALRRVVSAFDAGLEPAGIAFAGVSTVLVAARGAGAVTVLDTRTGRHRRITTGGFPRAIAVHRRRAFILDEQSGRVTIGRV